MGLTSGTKLGSSEILLPLGARGEVYRARDTRLGRGGDLIAVGVASQGHGSAMTFRTGAPEASLRRAQQDLRLQRRADSCEVVSGGGVG